MYSHEPRLFEGLSSKEQVKFRQSHPRDIDKDTLKLVKDNEKNRHKSDEWNSNQQMLSYISDLLHGEDVIVA